MGAAEVPRADFVELVERACRLHFRPRNWSYNAEIGSSLGMHPDEERR